MCVHCQNHPNAPSFGGVAVILFSDYGIGPAAVHGLQCRRRARHSPSIVARETKCGGSASRVGGGGREALHSPIPHLPRSNLQKFCWLTELSVAPGKRWTAVCIPLPHPLHTLRDASLHLAAAVALAGMARWHPQTARSELIITPGTEQLPGVLLASLAGTEYYVCIGHRCTYSSYTLFHMENVARMKPSLALKMCVEKEKKKFNTLHSSCLPYRRGILGLIFCS